MIKKQIIAFISIALCIYGFIKISGFAQKADTYTFDQNEWITTETTLFTTDIYQPHKKPYNLTEWSKIPKGLKLTPIVRYGNFAVVDLPDGRRGLVSPLTLSGIKINSVISEDSRGYGIDVTSMVSTFKKSRFIIDDTVRVVECLSYDSYQKIYKNGRRLNKNVKVEPPMVVLGNSVEGVFVGKDADVLWPAFAANMPHYNCEYKSYVRRKDIDGLTMEEVNKKYGEPQSILYNSNKDVVAFYSQLSTLGDVNYLGRGIRYKAGTGEAQLENMEIYGKSNVTIDPKKLGEGVELNEATLDSLAMLPWMEQKHVTRTTSWFLDLFNIGWDILPLSGFIVRTVNFNPFPLYTVAELEALPEVIRMLIAMAIIILVGAVLQSLVVSIMAPNRAISNNSISTTAMIVIIPTMIVLCAVGIEYAQSAFIIMALFSAAAVLYTWYCVDSYVDFHRCPKCRRCDVVTHTRTLVDKYSDYDSYTETYSEKEMSDSYHGPSRKVDASNASDFDTWNKRTTTKYAEDVVRKKTTKVFRLDFTCHSCDHKWKSIEKETDTKEVSRKKRVTGRKKEWIED